MPATKSQVNKKQIVKKQTPKKVQKTVSKKVVKRVAKKTVKKTETKPRTNRIRHFSIIYKGERLNATPSGKRPKQAANKALTSIFAFLKEQGQDISKLINTDIKFFLYENGKRRKSASNGYLPRRVFAYTGKRVELKDDDKPIEIKHEVIKYCTDCIKRINDLKTADKEHVMTKKQIMKNIKLLKKYLKTDAKERKDEMINEHIKKYQKQYEEIIKCSKCVKEEKTITYKYTNTVKKTPESELNEDDKKITSDFVEEIETKRKEEAKKEDSKKEPKKETKPVEKKEPKKETKTEKKVVKKETKKVIKK